MSFLISFSAIALLVFLADLATAKIVCPQVVANDPSPVFCATNAYGSLDVTRSQFENWNCNHPFNKYTQVSQVACTPAVTPETCTPASCDNAGPLVCARLPSPDPRWKNAFTTAVFGNSCQLTLYNCINKKQPYESTTETNMARCISIGL